MHSKPLERSGMRPSRRRRDHAFRLDAAPSPEPDEALGDLAPRGVGGADGEDPKGRIQGAQALSSDGEGPATRVG